MDFYANELKWLEDKGQNLSLIFNDSFTNSNTSYVRGIGSNFTHLVTDIYKQKYYEITPSDFIPVGSGEIGAYASEYKIFAIEAEGNKSGVVSKSRKGTQRNTIDASMSEATYKTIDWEYDINYSRTEIERAKAGKTLSIDLVRLKESETFRQFQLDVQKAAFLGVEDLQGLLNQSGVTVDTSTISNFLYTLTLDQLNTTVTNIVNSVANNLQEVNLSFPDTLVISPKEARGLKATSVGTEFGVTVSKYDRLLSLLKDGFNNQNFQIKELAYADKARNANVLGGNGKNRYVLYRNDPLSMKMHIQRNYTTSAYHTANGHDFTCVATAAYGGLDVFRKHEVTYFDHTS